jgi:hypothetical protein
MTTTENIGCPFCSNANEVTSPDPEYTKVSNTDKQGTKSAKYTCSKCNEENVVYWSKKLIIYSYFLLYFVFYL